MVAFKLYDKSGRGETQTGARVGYQTRDLNVVPIKPHFAPLTIDDNVYPHNGMQFFYCYVPNFLLQL